MNTNVNLLAPIGGLALVGTGFLLLVAALILIQSLIVHRKGRAKIVLLAMVVIAAAYLAATLIFSLASHENVLARGEEKHFCEIDCHLPYSIVNTQLSKTLGNPPNQTTAQGSYTVVTIKTRFDETTISPPRGNALLYPNRRVLKVIDERGNQYSPSIEAQQVLDKTSTGYQRFTTPLRPGESYLTQIVFDLPADAKVANLLINEGEWETHLVIGHENSPLHRKTRFQL